VFMTRRYFVTNPVCSMMIKMSVQRLLLRPTVLLLFLRKTTSEIYDCGFHLLFCVMRLENLGISGFGIGIPNNLCCIQTIQITI
jgi:hypothetical protein